MVLSQHLENLLTHFNALEYVKRAALCEEWVIVKLLSIALKTSSLVLNTFNNALCLFKYVKMRQKIVKVSVQEHIKRCGGHCEGSINIRVGKLERL